MKQFFFIFSLFYIFSNFNIAVCQDFEVAPVKIYFEVEPGESETKILTIKNHSSFKTSYSLTIEDFIIDNKGNKQTTRRNSTKNSCSEWISFEKNFFDINPNESIDIKVTMQPPSEDISSRWAMIYVQTVQEKTSFDADKSTRTGIGISARIAVQVYRSTRVKSAPNAKISNLIETNSNIPSNRNFSALVENKGASIINCKVIFVASNLYTAEEFEFEPILFESFPGNIREIEFTLPNSLAAGEYSLAVLLDYGNKNTIEGTRLKNKLIITK